MAQFDILAIYLLTELPRISIMCLQMSVLKQLTITKGVCLQPELQAQSLVQQLTTGTMGTTSTFAHHHGVYGTPK